MDFTSLFSSTSVLFSVLCVAAVAFWKWSNSSSSPPPVKVPSLINPTIKKKEKPKDSKEDIIAKGLIPVKIFYASQTGTAEDFSHKIASESKRYKFHPTVVDLEEYEKSELGSEGFAIFLIATYGEGEPTDNSREFYEWLKDESLDSELLKGLKFTVFGLGNKTYEHYNAMARFFDKRLEELGAERIFQRGEGDDDASLEDDFAAWKKELWPQLVSHFKIDVPIGSADNETERRYKVKTFEADSAIAKTSKNNTHKHLAKRDTNTTYSIKNPYVAKVLENKELHSSDSDRSCRHVEIEIGKALTYEPGDHLGIYPENDPSLVEELGKRLEQDLDVVFALYPVDNETKPYLGPCTYRQAFLQWSDLTSPPRKTVLKVFAELATDPKEKKRLELLSDPEKQQPYARWIKDEMRTVLEILNEFPSVKIPADHLIEILPRLAARYYSISSSLQANPGRVHITCVLVDFETPTKRRHLGVCSHWLTKQIPTQEFSPSVYVFMEEAKFRLPKDPAIPTIMIGPGTGVAPFRGFIQERNLLHQKGTITENFLFFGCRNSNLDFLYKEELLTYEKNGLLKLSIAFSRETEQKVYVQHKIGERKEELWEFLHLKKGYFYICGDARAMAKDVNQALKTLIMEKLEKTEEEANQYIADLQKDGRYFTDIWF